MTQICDDGSPLPLAVCRAFFRIECLLCYHYCDGQWYSKPCDPDYTMYVMPHLLKLTFAHAYAFT